jgi:hypothetical protein
MHSGAGSILPLTFCGSKAGATFCLAMISIVDRLKRRVSQRCRNNRFLTFEMENGAPGNFSGEQQRPPPWCVRGAGGCRAISRCKTKQRCTSVVDHCCRRPFRTVGHQDRECQRTFRLTGTRDGLVVPQSVSAAAEAQAVRVVPGLAGVAVGLPVLHRGAGGFKALGLGWRVQPWMQR